MPLGAFVLVLLAAMLHTGWNLVLKHVQEKHVVTWWALVGGSVVFLPLLVWSPPPSLAIWPYAIASALAETAYFVALIWAYQHADFSLVYPLARGTAPALLTAWAILFLGEQPQPVGLIGLALLLLGVMIVGGGWRWFRERAAIDAVGIRAALIVAACISIYSAIDAAAVRLMDPLPYTVLIIGLTAVCTAPLVILRYGYRTILSVGRAYWRSSAIVGILMMLTYMLVLQAYTLAQVSYVGALREVSVVFAALAGWRSLREPFGAMRTSGAVLIFCGLVAIAAAG